jgi:hypothetical protein
MAMINELRNALEKKEARTQASALAQGQEQEESKTQVSALAQGQEQEESKTQASEPAQGQEQEEQKREARALAQGFEFENQKEKDSQNQSHHEKPKGKDSETKTDGFTFYEVLNDPRDLFSFVEFMDIQYAGPASKNPNRLNAEQWKKLGKAVGLNKKDIKNRITTLNAVNKKYANSKGENAFVNTARKGLLNQTQFALSMIHILGGKNAGFH